MVPTVEIAALIAYWMGGQSSDDVGSAAGPDTIYPTINDSLRLGSGVCSIVLSDFGQIDAQTEVKMFALVDRSTTSLTAIAFALYRVIAKAKMGHLSGTTTCELVIIS